MFRAFLIGLACLAWPCFTANAQHSGPDYGPVPSGCERDNGSRTFDNARGGYTVTWTDRFNKKHTVTPPPTGSVTVVFPIPNGGSWIWFQQGEPKDQRTGFNPAVVWVEALLWREGDHTRMQAYGFRLKGDPPDPGLWGEIKDRIEDVKKIVEVGAKTGVEAKTIASAAGLVK